MYHLINYVSAAEPGDGSGIFVNPLKGTSDFAGLIVKILDTVIKIGIPVLVLFIVYAGFLFVTAQGNTTKIDEAKSALWWAVLGGAVLLGAKAIAAVICATLSVTCPIS